MATRQGTITDNNNGTVTVLWEQLTDTGPDSGTAVDLSAYPVKTVQVVGDFTSSGAVTIQGSNDNSSWATLRDNLGTSLVITTTGPRLIGENTRYIRPLCSAGTSVDMDVYIQASKDANFLVPGYISSSLLTFQEKSVVTATAATLVNGTTIFTVSGGPIRVMDLISYCETVCDTTASTLKWIADGDATNQTATDLTGASGSLASFAVGGLIYCNFTTLATAPVITATTGVALYGPTTSTGGGVYVPAGAIKTTIGTGSTTGTFRHYMRYIPLSPSSTVS